jgi:plasmid stabilization system protein ParE
MKAFARPAFYQDVEREQLWLLENVGSELADKWHEAVWETIWYLASHPEFGRLRKDLKFDGIRSWRVNGFKRWLIFYGVRENTLVLYRVVGGQMDLTTLILG